MSISLEGNVRDLEAQTSPPTQSASSSRPSSTSHPKPKKTKRLKVRLPKIEPIKNGYRDIAHLMAYEDSPFAIFRRFGQLNMLILLSLQAELMELQGQFKAVCKVDDDCSDPTSARRRFAYSFNAMRKKYNPETTIDPRDKTGNGYVSLMQAPAEIRQYGLILEIREKLKEYNATILQLSEMKVLRRPGKEKLEGFRTWLMKERHQSKEKVTGLSDYASEGQEYLTWMDMEDLDDLVAIEPPASERDAFQEKVGNWITWIIIKVLDFRLQEVSPKTRFSILKKGRAAAAGPSFLAVTLASMLPSVSVLALYHIKNIPNRIYALMGITFFVALGLKYLARAKSMEVFAVTAAFVAVEVVFVGSATSS